MNCASSVVSQNNVKMTYDELPSLSTKRVVSSVLTIFK